MNDEGPPSRYPRRSKRSSVPTQFFHSTPVSVKPDPSPLSSEPDASPSMVVTPSPPNSGTDEPKKAPSRKKRSISGTGTATEGKKKIVRGRRVAVKKEEEEEEGDIPDPAPLSSELVTPPLVQVTPSPSNGGTDKPKKARPRKKRSTEGKENIGRSRRSAVKKQEEEEVIPDPAPLSSGVVAPPSMAVTPSPSNGRTDEPKKARKRRSAVKKEEEEEEDIEADGRSNDIIENVTETEGLEKKAGRSTTRNVPIAKKQKRATKSVPVKKEGRTLPAPKKEKKPRVKKSKVVVVPSVKDDGDSDAAVEVPAAGRTVKKEKKPRVRKPKVVIVPSVRDDGDSDAAVEVPAVPSDPNAFKVSYAKTGRACCRRCDEKIPKGEVRISHRPLFRGKPGFEIHRHLACSIFSDKVSHPDDVVGHSDLEPGDYELLADRIEAAKLELKKEMEELRPDELVAVTFEGPVRPSPPGLTATLLPFQKEGVSWMYRQETSCDIRGGILADEMGLGKTLQTITTVLDNRPKLQHCKPDAKFPPDADTDELSKESTMWDQARRDWDHEMRMMNIPQSTYNHNVLRGGTLVICPMVALSQWKSEIEKFSSPNTLTVCIYHGPDRATTFPPEVLSKYDVVLSTYQVMESDRRKMISPNKVTCPNCKNKYKLDKLRVHLKYFCGEGAQRTAAQSRQVRARDRQPGGAGAPGGAAKGGDKKPKMKKVMKKTVLKKHHKEADREPTPDVVTSLSDRRPSSRKAAAKATQKLTDSVKGWMTTSTPSDDQEDDDASVHSEDSDDEDDGSVDSESNDSSENSSSDSDDDDDDDDDDEEERIIAKQREALERPKKFKQKQTPGVKKKAQKPKSKPIEITIDTEALLKQSLCGSKMSPLHGLVWWRVVLDEAHYIKSRSSQTAHAAFALIGIHRWCLSGTPLQNRVGEFYSLVRFLRIDPMAHYSCRCKDCDCKSLHYRILNGVCQDCNHGSVNHFSHFNKFILNPIQRDGYSGDGRRAMFILKEQILDKCLLRRTKESRKEDMELPPRLVTIRTVKLHPIEEDFYNALYTRTRSSFDDYVSNGTLLNNYAHIFDLLMRMRQSVDHPYLIVYSKKGVHESVAATLSAPQVANGTVDCDICHEQPTDRVVSACCGAAFCRGCVMEYMATSAGIGGERGTPCPSCRSPFSIDLNQVSSQPLELEAAASPDSGDDSSDNGKGKSYGTALAPSLKDLPYIATGSILRRINLAEFATSTKIEALTEELCNMRRTSPGSKAIVFSQFVNMLDLIRWRLHSDPCLVHQGLTARSLHGGMSAKVRDKNLKEFREDVNVRVMLISLKAGGVALNLTVANHIYLMDPWWNPAAEMQAIDRTHRIGQFRPIRAVRFIAENTVEERILQLQEKKRLVFDGTIGRDASSLTMLSVDDMKSLFT